MSRFKNSPRTAAASTVTATGVAESRANLFAPAPLRQAIATGNKTLPVSDAGSSNIVASFGFVLYCAYLLSGLANDWAIRLIGTKVYISNITLVLLPFAWLLSGNALRGLKRPVGRWWVAFLVCLLLATPFSVWRGGSASMLWNYVPRSYLSFFYISAFVTSLRRCRALMYVNIVGAVVLLLTCMKFGGSGSGSDDGRFVIPNSLFYANANELGLALLLAVTSFLFLLYKPAVITRMLGMGGILLSILFALKTGSRGCLLAAIALFGMVFFFSRNKVMTIIFVLPMIGLALLMLPGTTMRRLLLFGTDPGVSEAQTSEDLAAIGSQLERRELFKTSLALTIRHPIFGVGPDEFAVAAAGDAAKKGVRAAWLGTHNSYTQVSSECGIPALICYCAVLIFCFRSNWRMYRQSRHSPALKDVTTLSFCLLASALVYAVSTFFFHIAYSGGLPMQAGFSLALRLAAEPLVAGRTAES
ncbi:MAG TPA: O-antigen ligase family protein [Bryobacteraceae bacterium]|jgi:O-antigen ligase|nr:O-antigen ligase family protein [Bryobacteraceae bacterium]